MSNYVFDFVIVVASILLAVSVIVSLIMARENNEKTGKRIDTARIYFIILIAIYIVYGILRNLR